MENNSKELIGYRVETVVKYLKTGQTKHYGEKCYSTWDGGMWMGENTFREDQFRTTEEMKKHIDKHYRRKETDEFWLNEFNFLYRDYTWDDLEKMAAATPENDKYIYFRAFPVYQFYDKNGHKWEEESKEFEELDGVNMSTYADDLLYHTID